MASAPGWSAAASTVYVGLVPELSMALMTMMCDVVSPCAADVTRAWAPKGKVMGSIKSDTNSSDSC